mgnify:CR=1 FL=1
MTDEEKKAERKRKKKEYYDKQKLDPDFKIKQAENQRAYQAKNRERIKARDAAKYKEADKEHIKQVTLDRFAKFDAERLEEEKQKASWRKAKYRAIPENREKEKADKIEYRKKNGEAMAAREKEYKTGKGRPYYWKRQGITLTVEEHDKMLAEQNGCCKICGEFRLPEQRVLVVDHNHETGKIRGLLCHPCNMGIGQLKDSVDVLRKAILYLEEGDG